MASSPLAILSNMDINDTIGALYIGGIVVAIFFGITTVQTYLYFTINPRDRLTYKIAVGVLWVFDAVQLAFVVHAGYHYAVSNYSNPVALISVIWSLVAQVVLTTLSDTIVRSIFGHRVYLLSGGNPYLSVVIAGTTVSVMVGGIYFAVRLATVKTFLRIQELSWILYFSLGTLTLADVIISIALCVLLRKQGATAFSHTRSIVRSIMLYSINGSALTSLCAVVCLITYATMSTNFIFQAFYFVLPKLYLNSLLATLNARGSLRQALGKPDVVSIPMSKPTISVPNMRRSSNSKPPRDEGDMPFGIRIETTTDRMFDHREGSLAPTTPKDEKWTSESESI